MSQLEIDQAKARKEQIKKFNDFFRIEFKNKLSSFDNWCSVIGWELYNNRFIAEKSLKCFRDNHLNSDFEFRMVKIKMSKYVLKK